MNSYSLPLDVRVILGRVDTDGYFAEVERRIRAVGLAGATFEIRLPGGRAHTFGSGTPAFHVVARDGRGLRALTSFDDLSIAEAYMHGHVDIEGDLFALLEYRKLLSDRRPLQYVWEHYLQPMVQGQIAADKGTIPQHYDLPSEFFELWLDERVRGYSHAFFADDAEPLGDAMVRKIDWAMAACNIKPGDRVLDIGGGWGSFLEYAGKKGVHVTSLTISKVSAAYMREIILREKLSCEVIESHLLEFKSERPFDAIVNLGVSEHLPDYRRTVAQYERLLAPGRRIYLDFYSGQRFSNSSFVTRWVYEGNTSPVNLPRYLAAVERQDFEVTNLEWDGHNYELTCRKWAERLEAKREEIVRRWGELLYRRFRLYLWGCARAFADGSLSAHHLVLERRPGLRRARRLFQF
jgi:cyclopropane-fatty-acyl-phospholipid synthase